MAAIEEYVAEEAEGTFGRGVLTNLGKGVAVKTVELVLDTKLKMHDYYLLNTTYIRRKGEEQLLSVGVLGHVFTFDKDMLREKLNEAARGGDADDESRDEP